jgi:hypothetical protein
VDLRIFSHQDNVNLPIFTVNEAGQLPPAGQLFQPPSGVPSSSTKRTVTSSTSSLATTTNTAAVTQQGTETVNPDVDLYIQKAETVFGRKITGLKKKDDGLTTVVTRATTVTPLQPTKRATASSPTTTARTTTPATTGTEAPATVVETTAAQSQLLRSTLLKYEEAEKCDHPVEAYVHKAETLFGRKVTGVRLHQPALSGQTTRRPAPVFSTISPGRTILFLHFLGSF